MLAGGKKAIFGEQFFFLECDRLREILVGPRANKLVEKSSPAATFWGLLKLSPLVELKAKKLEGDNKRLPKRLFT